MGSRKQFLFRHNTYQKQPTMENNLVQSIKTYINQQFSNYQFISMIIVILVLFTLLPSASPQYQSGWDILLEHQPTSIQVNTQGAINKQQVLVGLTNGTLLVLSAHSKIILKTVDVFNDQINAIEVDQQGIIFVVGATSITQLDRYYKIITVLSLEGSVKLIGLTRSSDKYYLNYMVNTNLYTRQYPNISHARQDVWLSNQKHSIASISSSQDILFIVSQDNTQFSMSRLTKDVEKENRNKNIESLVSTNRKFNFKVTNILLDYKSGLISEDALLITDEETIFYTRSGNIVTYVPYRHSQNHHLIAVDYCEDSFIVILHSREFDDISNEYYVTLVRTYDLASLKVIVLNDIFAGNFEIQNIDCNHNLLVFQTKQGRILILQRYPMFSLSDYVLEFTISTVFILSLMLFVCRFKSKQSIQENPSNNSINEVLGRTKLSKSKRN